MSKYFDDLLNFDGTILNPEDVFTWIFTIEDFIIDNILEEKQVKVCIFQIHWTFIRLVEKFEGERVHKR